MGYLWTVGLMTLAAQAPAPQPSSAIPFLSPTQLQRLQAALEPWHARYDPNERMIREPLQSPGYHTTLRSGLVHPTRSSLSYAVALLDTGEEQLSERAGAILRRVIALQDADPASKTYGIWPWFLEEPLAQMSPPDWNWADFCGVQLLQVARDHLERLPADLRAQVTSALLHAARSIQRRNVGPNYTNIAIMGAYVTLVTAELLGIDDLRAYALDRWRRFYEYTRQHGAFTEYNSPTYTVVAIEELGRMRLQARHPEAQRWAEELYGLAWREIALHFHPPTRQWAGPHSRCYETLLGERTLALLQRATAGRVNFGADTPRLTEHRLPLPCPPELEHYFLTMDGPRDLTQTFLNADPPLVGATHLEPAFALGSINRGELWNQRRPLLAYWGTSNAPAFFRLRLLRDGYDFAAAQFFSVQRGGDVLAAVNFATDGGNTHLSLDRLKDGVVTVAQLRLRFEFGGAASGVRIPLPGRATDPIRLRFGDVRWQLVLLRAVFGSEPGRWEATTEGNTSGLDWVLYQGEAKTIRLGELDQAALGFALRLSTQDAALPEGTAQLEAPGRLSLRWAGLALSLPIRPANAQALQQAFRATGSESGKTPASRLDW
jgi:hypothetical protein